MKKNLAGNQFWSLLAKLMMFIFNKDLSIDVNQNPSFEFTLRYEDVTLTIMQINVVYTFVNT